LLLTHRSRLGLHRTSTIPRQWSEPQTGSLTATTGLIWRQSGAEAVVRSRALVRIRRVLPSSARLSGTSIPRH